MSADPERAKSGGDLLSFTEGTNSTGLLRLIATSDLHGQFLSYDYFANRQLPGSGLAQIACLIEEARRGAPASLLLDNGDFLQGGALGDTAAMSRGKRPHPAIAAFTALGYDAVALGNHEFDYGLDHLSRIIDATDLPVLSTNVLNHQGITPLSDQHYTTPALLLTREIGLADGSTHPVTIGIFALTPPETLHWNARWIKDRLIIRQMEETARAWVPELRRQGADIVVCLAHTGIGQPFSPAPGESQAAIIAAIPGIDAVIAGHSHLTFPDQRSHPDPRVNGQSGHIAGTPVVQPGHEGSHLGVIDLWLDRDNNAWKVTRSRSRVIAGPAAVAGMPYRMVRDASAPLRVALAQDHSAALFRMRQRLGTASVPLSTWFANVADSQSMRLVGTALSHHTRARLANGPLAGVPVVSLVHSFRSGGRGGPLNYADVPAGHISLRHVFGLYPFPNTLTALLINGAGLSARLDHATALLNQIFPGMADQAMTNPSIPGFSFASAVGASYQIDLSVPPPALQTTNGRPFGEGRIRDLRIGGRLLAADDPVVLVVSNYITDATGRQQGHLQAGRLVLDEGQLCTDVIAGYIREAGRIGPDDSPGWRFAPMPGTTALFDSGSGAEARLESAAALRPEPLGLLPSGFSRFRLHL